MASGDYCSIRRTDSGEFRVQHWACDEYPDGTVTDPHTMRIVTE